MVFCPRSHDFISDDRNKKFQSFSCNSESYINFNNLYLEVNEQNAIQNRIIDSSDLKNPKYKSVANGHLKGACYTKQVAV